MTNRQIVSPRELERRRRKASALARHVSPERGWNADATAASTVASLFSRLSVRDGIQLVTLAARAGAGGNGWTYALPEKTQVPTPAHLELAAAFPPAPPKGALSDVMDAVEGDGSLRSYVQASILSREIGELGAWWHGLGWSTHTLLDNGEGPFSPRPALQPLDAYTAPDRDQEWRWGSDPPKDWRPVAARESAAVTVVFWTISALGTERIVRSVDRYADGSLRPFDSAAETVAEGPGGFVF